MGSTDPRTGVSPSSPPNNLPTTCEAVKSTQTETVSSTKVTRVNFLTGKPDKNKLINYICFCSKKVRVICPKKITSFFAFLKKKKKKKKKKLFFRFWKKKKKKKKKKS